MNRGREGEPGGYNLDQENRIHQEANRIRQDQLHRADIINSQLGPMMEDLQQKWDKLQTDPRYAEVQDKVLDLNRTTAHEEREDGLTHREFAVRLMQEQFYDRLAAVDESDEFRPLSQYRSDLKNLSEELQQSIAGGSNSLSDFLTNRWSESLPRESLDRQLDIAHSVPLESSSLIDKILHQQKFEDLSDEDQRDNFTQTSKAWFRPLDLFGVNTVPDHRGRVQANRDQLALLLKNNDLPPEVADLIRRQVDVVERPTTPLGRAWDRVNSRYPIYIDKLPNHLKPVFSSISLERRDQLAKDAVRAAAKLRKERAKNPNYRDTHNQHAQNIRLGLGPSA